MGAAVRKRSETTKKKILNAAAKLFLTNGYENSTVKAIAQEAGVNLGSLTFAFKSKEALLCELVGHVFDAQFEATEKLLQGKTEDKILFYAAETTLQLCIAESSEHMREMYNVSYSLPNSAQVVYHKITGKLEHIFKEHLPHLATKDFFELEIASAGIMRNFMSVPCTIYFTMEDKIARFLETTFLVYRVSDEKIGEAVEFVSRFDFKKIADDVLKNMLNYLESKT